MNDNDEMEHDVGLDMECAEETDDQHIIHVKREPIDNEKEDSSDEVPLLVDSGCHIKAEPPGDEEEDSDFTVMRYQGCVESGIFGEGGTDMTSVVVKTEPCDQTDPCDDQVKFDSTRLGNMATFQFETFSSNSPDQVIKTGPDCNNIPFEVDQNGQMELHDLESKRVCVKTERCIEGTDNELNSGRSGSTVFSGGPSNVCVFPHADTTRDSTHLEDEWQGLAGLSDTGDEESVGSPCLHPNYSAAPRPGLLPIHVVDPLHSDGMKIEEEEEEPSLSVTGVIPNLHAQHTAIQLGLTSPETEALDLRQAVGQSTGEPAPVCFMASSTECDYKPPAAAIRRVHSSPVPRSLAGATTQKHRPTPKRCDTNLEKGQIENNEQTCTPLEIKPFTCEHCEMRFKKKSHLTEHKRIHTGEKPFRCEQCDMTFSRKCNLIQHEYLHTGEKLFKCEYCEKRFTRKRHLAQHEFVHTGEKPFKCGHCEKRFPRKQQRKQHERLHTGEKPFGCQHCEKRFHQKSGLKHHVLLHAGEKMYACEHCDMKFTQKSALTVHDRIHTGERPFKCSHCELKFARKSDVKQHERVHTGEKPFGCEHCGMRFSRKPSLTRHVYTHTGQKPFRCKLCEMRFTQKYFLTEHERVHIGERSFKCEHCEMSFTQKAQLKRHEHVHSVENLFMCKHCDNMFTKKYHLTQHESSCTHTLGKQVQS